MSDTMDQEKAGWFHCGRCGALFGAEVGEGVPVRCPECGRDPVVEHSELAYAQAASSTFQAKEGAVFRKNEGSQRKGKPKKKKGGGLGVFVGIWVVLLLLLAGAVKFFRGEEVTDDSLGFGIATEDQRLVNEEFNECRRKLTEYIQEGSPERRAQFVINASENLRRMAGNQREIKFTSDDLELESWSFGVIGTPKGKALETVWKIDENRTLEAVFFREDDDWKIDWANMVRYSDGDWSLFLVDEGEEEKVFRLLARRRSGDPEGTGKVASVVLIGPKADSPGEYGASSPEVPVDPDSRIGRVLSAAFAKRDAKEGIYGSNASNQDPNGMIRLQVKVVRKAGEEEGEKSFVIRDIIACHWYDIDDLGLAE